LVVEVEAWECGSFFAYTSPVHTYVPGGVLGTLGVQRKMHTVHC
jgi:hypothetical protein